MHERMLQAENDDLTEKQEKILSQRKILKESPNNKKSEKKF
jgi:hypothetical protein